MANFFDQFDGGGAAQAALPTGGSQNFFDQFDDKNDLSAVANPLKIVVAPGGFDRAFGQFEEQPAPAPADQQRMEQLASAYGRAPDGQGQAVDARAEEIRRTTNPYVQATMQGLTLGFEDEIGAGIRTMAGQGNGYDFNLAAQREALDRSRQESPIGMAAAELGGSVLSAPLLPGGAVAGGSRLARAGAAARQGAIYGGVYGAGTGEGAADRATGAIGGAAVGGAVGGVIGAALPGASRPVAKNSVMEAGERVGVPIPTAIASNSMIAQRGGQALRNIPFVGDAIPRATRESVESMGGVVTRVADEMGSGSPNNVANRVGRVIGGAADAETGAATRAAQQADAQALAQFEARTKASRSAVDAADNTALAQAQRAVGNMSPQDMGQTLIARLKAGEAAARQNKEALYGIASQPGSASIKSNAVREAHGRIAQALENAGRPIDTTLTPAAARMLDEVARLSSLTIQNKAVGTRPAAVAGEEITKAAVDINGIELVRKRLNGLSRAASNDADRSASKMIVREFDNWLEDAFDNALFSGSDDALKAFQSARKANADWRTKFGYNNRDDADKVINKIVTGEVTPQEVGNWVVGATKVGAQGLSSRLLVRVAEATANDPAAIAAIRGGVWNRLAHSTSGVEAKAAPKTANEIYEFVNGSGRDVARRLFDNEQRGFMTAYADTLRKGVNDRAAIDAAVKTGAPKPTEVGIGPMQELANTVIGRGRTDEAIFDAVNAYAKSGSRGDIQTLSSILRALPQEDRGNLAGAMVRNLGVSPRSGQWTPDVFLSQWRTYTPQAKSLLFGNAGEHRAALDDIATIAQRFQEVGRMFGNPSGTAQNANAVVGAGAILAEPVTAITTALGGMVAARVLASPATARSMARWARAYEAAVKAPARGARQAFNAASNRFSADIARELGLTQYTQQITGALRGAIAEPSADQGVENPRPVDE